MSLKDLVNSADWVEVEMIIEEKMNNLALDFPEQTTQQAIALHALANKKAYRLLKEFLEQTNFYKGEDKPPVKRDFR